MNFPDNLVLASGSPRRQQLLKDAGFKFEVIVKEIDEVYPLHLVKEEVALFLAAKKAAAYDDEVTQGKIILTADTIVYSNGNILEKPVNYDDAISMLKNLSGQTHEVITAACLRNKASTSCFHVTTRVTFRKLTDHEIEWYVTNYKPFDKAGGYGIQEWIGLVAITRIEGSYPNVVGLPVHEVYEKLMATNAEADL